MSDDEPAGFLALPHATYETSPLVDHKGNPLIEALPPYQLVSEMDQEFGCFPPPPGADLKLSRGQRSLAVGRLRRWLQPLTRHEGVIDLIGNVIRNGYVGRNPVDARVAREKVRFYRDVVARDGMLSLGRQTSSTAPSMALFGTSGVGKTTVVEFALNQLFPQVVYHPGHRIAQIVWMKVDCPAAGSLKQLLAAMVEAMEDLVQSDHRASIKYETTDPLVLLVARMATKFNVGLIVVDEIQNLLLSGHQDRAKMLNFLVSMANVARIPIMTMGTPLARDLMANQLRQARRTGDMGTIMWDRMPRDPEWEFFLEGMFKYQWVTDATAKTPHLSKVIHAETAGIPALVVRLFQLAQLRAIADGTERVSAKALKEVAQERFSLLRPMLDAIRAGKDVSRWEDLFAEQLENIDRDVASGTPGAAAPRTGGRSRPNRAKALAQLSPLYGTSRSSRAVDEVLDGEPDLDVGDLVDRARAALDDSHPIYDQLPPSLTEVVGELTSSGSGALQAVATANDRARTAAKRPRRGSTEV